MEKKAAGGFFIMLINTLRESFIQLPSCIQLVRDLVDNSAAHSGRGEWKRWGGDKDSTDHRGQTQSTQQPEDPSEHTEHVSLSSVWFVVHVVMVPTKPIYPGRVAAPVVDKLGTTVQSVVIYSTCCLVFRALEVLS